MCEDEDDPDLEYLRVKASKSAKNVGVDVLEAILKDERTKNLISKTITKESIKNGFMLSSIILGAMSIFNYIKSVYSPSWLDLGIGIVLLGLGGLYYIKKGI